MRAKKATSLMMNLAMTLETVRLESLTHTALTIPCRGASAGDRVVGERLDLLKSTLRGTPNTGNRLKCQG
jgi:hypothetical protein